MCALLGSLWWPTGVQFLEFVVDWIEDGKTWHLLQVKGFRVVNPKKATGQAPTPATGTQRPSSGRRARPAGSDAKPLRRSYTTPTMRFQGDGANAGTGVGTGRRASVASSVSTALSTARSGGMSSRSHVSSHRRVPKPGDDIRDAGTSTTRQRRRSSVPAVTVPEEPGANPRQEREPGSPQVANVKGLLKRRRAAGRGTSPAKQGGGTGPARPQHDTKAPATTAKRRSKRGKPRPNNLDDKLEQFKFKPYRGVGETTGSRTTSSAVFVNTPAPEAPPATPEWYRKLRHKHIPAESKAGGGSRGVRPPSPVRSPARPRAVAGSEGDVDLTESMNAQADDFVRSLFRSPKKAVQPPQPSAPVPDNAPTPPAVPSPTKHSSSYAFRPNSRGGTTAASLRTESGARVVEEQVHGVDVSPVNTGGATARTAASVTPRYEGMSPQDIANARRARPFKTASAVFAAFEDMLSQEAEFDAVAAARRAAAAATLRAGGGGGGGDGGGDSDSDGSGAHGDAANDELSLLSGSHGAVSALPDARSPLLGYSSDESTDSGAQLPHKGDKPTTTGQKRVLRLRKLPRDDSATIEPAARARHRSLMRGTTSSAARASSGRSKKHTQRPQGRTRKRNASGATASRVQGGAVAKKAGKDPVTRGAARRKRPGGARAGSQPQSSAVPVVRLPSGPQDDGPAGKQRVPHDRGDTARAKPKPKSSKVSSAEAHRRQRLAKAAVVSAYAAPVLPSASRARGSAGGPRRAVRNKASSGRRPAVEVSTATTHGAGHSTPLATPSSAHTTGSDVALLGPDDMALLEGSVSPPGGHSEWPTLPAVAELQRAEAAAGLGSPDTVGSDVPLLAMEDLMLLDGVSPPSGGAASHGSDEDSYSDEWGEDQ